MTEQAWSHYEDLPVDESFEYGTRFGVSDEMGSENIQFSVIRFEPGEGGPKHYHESPTEEYYIVLDGTLDIWVDGETVEAGPGTVVLTPPETPHSPTNNSDEPATLLAASSPKAAGGIQVIEGDRRADQKDD